MSEGATTCAIGERNGQVVLQFPEAVQWAAFDPETARQIGEAMARQAYELHTGLKADPGRSIISEDKRTRMITRATHVIRSLQDSGKLPGYIAAQVVDTILAEVR